MNCSHDPEQRTRPAGPTIGPTAAAAGRRPSRRAAAVAGAAFALAALVAGCSDDGTGDPTRDETTGGGTATFAGIERDPAPDVSGVALPDAAAGGEPFSLTAPDHGVLLVYFGFTNCPDMCPTTMADVRTALGDLPAPDAERVEVALITVDPARDTPEVVTSYARTFVADAHALRTDDDDTLRAAADAFGAHYQLTDTDTDTGEAEVGHSGHLYAVDDQGRLRVQWPSGTAAEELRHDLELLLDQQAGGAAADAAPDA